jgi:hypothetical protein
VTGKGAGFEALKDERGFAGGPRDVSGIQAGPAPIAGAASPDTKSPGRMTGPDSIVTAVAHAVGPPGGFQARW